MKSSNTEQVSQHFTLLRALMSDEGLDLGGIATLLGRTKRTAHRTVRELREAGVPIQEDVVDARSGRKAYRLPREWGPVPLPIDVMDALALRVLVLTSNLGDGSPFAREADRLETKLRGCLEPRQAALYDRVAALIARRSAGRRGAERTQPASSSAAAETLLDGARTRTVCDARYAKPGKAVEQYVLEPLGLFNRDHHFYCVARKRGPGTVQVFRLDRFRSVKRRRREHFSPPVDFDLEEFARTPLGVCHGPARHVRLRFDPRLASYAAETPWHESQRTELRPDGSLDVIVDVEGDEEILAWAARFADRAELIEPPELRAKLARRLSRAAARYERPVDGAARLRGAR